MFNKKGDSNQTTIFWLPLIHISIYINPSILIDYNSPNKAWNIGRNSEQYEFPLGTINLYLSTENREIDFLLSSLCVRDKRDNCGRRKAAESPSH